ncbi:VIT1/CCC1 transporter family protein [Microbacterium sp. NPDC057659]|uniref:VIT1/CCC1 transporter family protein n=1 Tax=Microbacterium sp. NPDC057659 TaxID=3346198 RepID=UPI00367360AE
MRGGDGMAASWWRRALRSMRETSWAIDANDGIISTAGLLQGFAGAGAGDRLLLFTAVATLIAGGLSAGGAKWAEVAAEREEEQRLAAQERDQLAADPRHERELLAAHWEEQGLTRDLAEQVAEQLSAHNALAAQLDAEHGIEELMPRSAPVLLGLRTMLAFMLGSAIPLTITFVAPVAIEEAAIITAVIISLVLTSLVAAVVGRLSARRMLVRTLVVGLGTMGVSYVAGLVFF